MAERASDASAGGGDVHIGLNAAVITLLHGQPHVLVVRYAQHPRDSSVASEPAGFPALPFGPFHAVRHRTLEMGLRAWVRAQTGLTLDYVEQLYTFGDQGRDPLEWQGGPRSISIGYLALVAAERLEVGGEAVAWEPLYDFFPWEDHRAGDPATGADGLMDALRAWADAGGGPGRRRRRRARVARTFGNDDGTVPWNEEACLERYELLYEAGLVPEARRDRAGRLAPDPASSAQGRPMMLDHRRILAQALSRLRAKIKYRPVIFDLMPAAFTLRELQQAVEAIAGLRLHTQNFRRLIARNNLVEPTGDYVRRTGGRPAALYRYRPDAVAARLAPAVRLPAASAGGDSSTGT